MNQKCNNVKTRGIVEVRWFCHHGFSTVLITICAVLSLTCQITSAQQIEPQLQNYKRLAFYPERWRAANVDFEMLAWEGENIVLLTKKGNYDAQTMTAFVKRLDQGWDYYHHLIGASPRPFRQINGKPTICALPKSNLSCGYGCGYVGASGIEASAFYSIDLPTFQKNANSFQHYYFYEMGRNYFVFGDRHSLFTTGYAVFMRYVCMDKLKCDDTDLRTRQTIERCEEIYAKSDVKFFDAFTNLGSGEKSNRLRGADGRIIGPSDQPVMYATAMLKLRKDYGGDEWVRKFFHRLRQCSARRATDLPSAKTQLYNWLVCASAAAGRDLTSIFVDRWRMPFRNEQRQIMAKTDWADLDISVSSVVSQLLNAAGDVTTLVVPVREDACQQQIQVSGVKLRRKFLATAKDSITVVPTPKFLKQAADSPPFKLNEKSRILFSVDGAPAGDSSKISRLGHVLSEELELITGVKPAVRAMKETTATDHDIVLQLDFNVQGNEEVYRLQANRQGLKISAGQFIGVAHGTSTLLQLLNADSLSVPAVIIEDEPTASFRNILIDVARNPISIGVLKDVVRMARLYKLRFIQLHLTDDQAFTFPFAPIIEGLKANRQRNYSYTKDELKELVDYADVRGVTIIPEIELPGHSSKIMQSGYLSPLDKNHRDIADPQNFDKLMVLVDEVLSVFHTSPYFHMGGDESGAGRKLVPLVSAINKHLRNKPNGQKRRLLVWEGFHGAPVDQIPATGDDRVIVMAWESSYNAPWELLRNGYEIINASWKPTYLTGGFGGLIHPGSSGGKRFSFEDIYRWDKNVFMHWEPGRPVYDDRGPNDDDRTDHEWTAEYIDRQDQVLGGMLVYWEQREGSVIHFIRQRLPIVAQRLWAPEVQLPFETFMQHVDSADERVFGIVQPVEILPVTDESQPVASLFRPYQGESVNITFRNRTRIPGVVRYSKGGFAGQLGSPNFRAVPVPSINCDAPVTMNGEFGVRAELVRENGQAVDGHSWAFFANWPMRVKVSEFDIGGRRMSHVPDLAAFSKVLRQYEMPYVRGLLQNVELVGQMVVSDFVAPQDGEFTFELRTQSGHATLYVDLNQNGEWESNEVLIRDTPNTEKGQIATVSLKSTQKYRLRLDHSNGMPRPVLILLVTPPNGRRVSVDQFLQLPKE